MRNILYGCREFLIPVSTILICIAVYLDSAGIHQASKYDLLGAAGFPRITVGVLALLSLYLIAGTLRELRHPDDTCTPAEDETVVADDSRWPFWCILGLTIMYALSLNFRIDFALSTFAFVLLASMLLAGWNLKTLVIGALIAAVVAWGCDYVFTKIFLIDLP